MSALDDRLVHLLSYPALDRDLAKERFSILEESGVEEVLDEGRVELGGHRVLGKGHASLVLAGIWMGRKAAIKVLRTDSKRNTLEKEALLLRLANSVGVGPKLYADLGFAVIMEFIPGIRFGEWVPKDGEEGRRIIRDLLLQCRKLDEIGLDHGELSNPARHVIVGPRVVIIDFESASLERRPTNVTSVAQHLFLSLIHI